MKPRHSQFLSAIDQLQPLIVEWFMAASVEQVKTVMNFTDAELLQLFAPLPEDGLPTNIFERMAVIEQRRSDHIAGTGEMVSEDGQS